MANNYVEGLQGLGPGSPGDLSLGSYGQQLTSDLFGKFGELARRGFVFSGVAAAAASILTVATSAHGPCLWNPASSGKIVIPLRILLSLGAVGTPILQGFQLNYLANAGDGIGTGAPVVTFTAVASVNTLIGKGNIATTKFAPATSTFTAAPAKLMDMGFGHLLEGAAASGQLYSMFYHDFDGAVILPPGALITLSSTITTSTTYWSTILYAEIAKPQVLN
jgi:hypothetical protein